MIWKKRDPISGLMVESDRIVVRKRYTDQQGRRREKKRYASTPTEAARIKRDIEREINEERAGAVSGVSRNFNDLAEWCKTQEFRQAEYVGETKVAGLRSWRSVASQLIPLVEFFGPTDLVAITYADLADYKRRRLRSISSRGRTRSLTSVNRELALLRRMLFVALRERWIRDHPFRRGAPLVQAVDEIKRMRILTWAEESALLAVCTGRRSHLRIALVFALETALRHNEQFSLKLSDVDLDQRVITLRSYNAKTVQTRIVPISDRLLRELEPVTRSRPSSLLNEPRSSLIFRYANLKRAFASACADLGIPGLRWQDLRHTAITRMLHHYRIPTAEVMKISGHSNWKTFLRYVNIDREIVRLIGARIDAARAEADPSAKLPVETAEETIEEISDAVN